MFNQGGLAMSLKIAVLGTGSVARCNYLPFLSKQPDVSLTLFSRTRAKAEECAKNFGGRVVGSVGELLDDQPDAVLVLTKETQRYDAAMALLEGRPKRLFFEKPLVARNGQANVCEDDFAQARELLRRARAAGAETAMIFNYRFFDQTVRAQRIVAERGFGRLIQASLLVNYACWSHCIDLLGLFGGRAVEMTALAGQVGFGSGNPKPVDVAGAFRLESGATGAILGTGGMKFDFSLYEIFLSFEKGIIHFSDLDGPMDVFDNAAGRYRESHELIGNHSRWDPYRASFEKSLAAYLDTIRRGVPPPIPGLAGLEELQFEAALRRSIAQKRPVNVQQEFPLEL
jgi:predicted dehydrogenase